MNYNGKKFNRTDHHYNGKKSNRAKFNRANHRDSGNPSIAKLLFQLLQIFHHLNRLDPSQGLPKAFKTKQRDLQQFFKPAQEGPDVKSELSKLSHNYISSCTTAIRAHYERQLNSLQEKISKSSVSLAEFQQAVLTAIKWGKDKKNFHKKLSDKTLTEFHRAINKLKLTLGKKESQVNIPIISTPQNESVAIPSQNKPVEVHIQNVPAAAAPPKLNGLGAEATSPFVTSPQAPSSGRLPPSPLGWSPIATTSTRQPSVEGSPNPPRWSPITSASTISSLGNAGPSQPEWSPKPQRKARSKRNRYPAIDPSVVSTPKKATGVVTCSNNTSGVVVPAHNGSRIPHPQKPSYAPVVKKLVSEMTKANRQTNLDPHQSSGSEQPGNVQPRNVQGAGDVLSNFYPFTFSYKGIRFRSSEHAYQYEKAMFLGDRELAEEIYGSQHAGQAKRFGSQLTYKHSNRPVFRLWEMKKKDIMRGILWEKSQQCDLFRSELLKTQNRKLTHNIPHTKDRFWATQYNKAGKTFPGEDVFAKLLTEIRGKLSKYTPPPLVSPSRSDLRTSWPPLIPTATTNRFQPLQGEEQVEEPENQTLESERSEPRNTALRNTASGRRVNKETKNCPKKTPKVTGNQLHIYGANEKNSWTLPACESKIVILGDSNLSKVTNIEGNAPVEMHSYSGAKPCHFERLLDGSTTCTHPSSVILSIGINSRDNKVQTTKTQMKKIAQSATTMFPNSKIFIPQINTSPLLSKTQTSNLEAFNKYIVELSNEHQEIQIISKMPQEKFKTDENGKFPGIHWQPETANDMICHWLSHLN